MPPSTIRKGALLYIYSQYYFLLLLIIKFFFSDDDIAKGKELPGTSGRGTPVQDKIVGELAKLNKQLADVFTQAMRSLFGH